MVFPLLRRLDDAVFDRPRLIVVVDTEEEFDWSAPFDSGQRAVDNIALQPMAQAIFDRHGVVPTYAVDYAVADHLGASRLLRGMASAGCCEIGAHLHPWVTPPHGGALDTRSSFPGNLPPALERAKLAALTARIRDAFAGPPVLYKAGRYGVGAATADILGELGYRIDASIVPFTDFSRQSGPDFSARDARPFVTSGGVVALPLSVGFTGRLARRGPLLFPRISGPVGRRLRVPGVAARLGLLQRLRLTPEGHTLADMVAQTRAGLAAGQRLFMLTYHSSSLLPGATPYVRDAAGRRDFLAAIDGFCEAFLGALGGRADTPAGVVAALLGEPPLERAA
jgi:hypothetical protein